MNLDYTKKDYQAVLDEIKAFVPTINSSWDDFVETDVGYALLRMFALLQDHNNYFLDKQAGESYLPTCTTRESAINLAYALGYTPKEKTPSSTIVRFTLASPRSVGFTIPRQTSVTISGKTFFTSEEIVFSPNQLSSEVLVYQGSTYYATYRASGAKWHKITVPTDLANLAVIVDGVLWERVNSFIYTENPQCYRATETAKGMKIMFGGGITATVPSNGAVIEVSGILCDGASGNLASVGLGVTIVDQIRDENAKQVSNLLIGVTLDVAVDGQDKESLQSIKQTAPLYYTTQNRAVTYTDYEAIVYANVSGVTNVVAWGGEDVERYGEVYVCIQGTDPTNVPQSLIVATEQILEVKRVQPMIVKVVTPHLIKCDVQCSVYIPQFASIANASSYAKTAIGTYFSGLTIGKELQFSDLLTGVVADQTLIDYANITFKLTQLWNVQANLLTLFTINNLDETSLIIRESDGTVLWTYGDVSIPLESTNEAGDVTITTHFYNYSLVANKLYLELPSGVDREVSIEFKSNFNDVYPRRQHLLISGDLTVTTFRSNQPNQEV